jgi:hypothetical protein
MTQEQILNQCQQAWPKWKREQFPKFIFESGTWYAHELKNTAGNGSTILEALYFHVNLMATYDTETGADASQWNAVLEVLVEHVADPIMAEYLDLSMDSPLKDLDNLTIRK